MQQAKYYCHPDSYRDRCVIASFSNSGEYKNPPLPLQGGDACTQRLAFRRVFTRNKESLVEEEKNELQL